MINNVSLHTAHKIYNGPTITINNNINFIEKQHL